HRHRARTTTCARRRRGFSHCAADSIHGDARCAGLEFTRSILCRSILARSTFAPSIFCRRSRRRLGVLEGVVEPLPGTKCARGEDDAPAVIIVAKLDCRVVTHIPGVKRGPNLVERDPSPREVDVGHIALL